VHCIQEGRGSAARALIQEGYAYAWLTPSFSFSVRLLCDLSLVAMQGASVIHHRLLPVLLFRLLCDLSLVAMQGASAAASPTRTTPRQNSRQPSRQNRSHTAGGTAAGRRIPAGGLSSDEEGPPEVPNSSGGAQGTIIASAAVPNVVLNPASASHSAPNSTSNPASASNSAPNSAPTSEPYAAVDATCPPGSALGPPTDPDRSPTRQHTLRRVSSIVASGTPEELLAFAMGAQHPPRGGGPSLPATSAAGGVALGAPISGGDLMGVPPLEGASASVAGVTSSGVAEGGLVGGSPFSGSAGEAGGVGCASSLASHSAGGAIHSGGDAIHSGCGAVHSGGDALHSGAAMNSGGVIHSGGDAHSSVAVNSGGASALARPRLTPLEVEATPTATATTATSAAADVPPPEHLLSVELDGSHRPDASGYGGTEGDETDGFAEALELVAALAPALGAMLDAAPQPIWRQLTLPFPPFTPNTAGANSTPVPSTGGGTSGPFSPPNTGGGSSVPFSPNTGGATSPLGSVLLPPAAPLPAPAGILVAGTESPVPESTAPRKVIQSTQAESTAPKHEPACSGTEHEAVTSASLRPEDLHTGGGGPGAFLFSRSSAAARGASLTGAALAVAASVAAAAAAAAAGVDTGVEGAASVSAASVGAALTAASVAAPFAGAAGGVEGGVDGALALAPAPVATIAATTTALAVVAAAAPTAIPTAAAAALAPAPAAAAAAISTAEGGGGNGGGGEGGDGGGGEGGGGNGGGGVRGGGDGAAASATAATAAPIATLATTPATGSSAPVTPPPTQTQSRSGCGPDTPAGAASGDANHTGGVPNAGGGYNTGGGGSTAGGGSNTGGGGYNTGGGSSEGCEESALVLCQAVWQAAHAVNSLCEAAAAEEERARGQVCIYRYRYR